MPAGPIRLDDRINNLYRYIRHITQTNQTRLALPGGARRHPDRRGHTFVKIWVRNDVNAQAAQDITHCIGLVTYDYNYAIAARSQQLSGYLPQHWLSVHFLYQLIDHAHAAAEPGCKNRRGHRTRIAAGFFRRKRGWRIHEESRCVLANQNALKCCATSSIARVRRKGLINIPE